MASQLREVLDRFGHQSAPVSLKQMAREMGIEPGILHGMIDYWVRKGKLREVSSTSANCQTCGIKGACPFVVALPRYYERAGDEEHASVPPCSCGGTCSH
jgi:hypothetical protein